MSEKQLKCQLIVLFFLNNYVFNNISTTLLASHPRCWQRPNNGKNNLSHCQVLVTCDADDDGAGVDVISSAQKVTH